MGMTKKAAWLALGLIALTAAPLAAEESDAARVARWQDLQHAVFGNRTVQDGTGVITLDAPVRALDAALVPIGVTIAGPAHIKALYLIVDGNPSPLAGTFHFGPAADPHSLRTRVRVEQYTLMHAVAETDDGALYGAERFVKAAGGCSAPMGKDATLAMSRMGQMRFRVEGGEPAPDGKMLIAQLLISHPNNNGMQVDQVSHNFVPARYIQDVKVTTGDQTVFTLDADISLSEDPAITFGFTPAGPVSVVVEDSARAVFKQSFDVAHHGT
jgi:sulfur-oxidizing protein SoxY